MKKKFSFLLLLISLLLLFFTGCNKKETPLEEIPIQQPPLEEQNKIEVTLYYPNAEYVNTGNEALDKLIPVKKEIEIKKESDLPLAILEELKQTPSNVSNISTSQLSNLSFLNAYIEDNTAFVDISSKNLSGGSLQESLILDQIIYSLTGLSQIKQVQFLVDSKIVETLMGHIDISKPLGREPYSIDNKPIVDNNDQQEAEIHPTSKVKVFLIAIDDNGKAGKKIPSGDSVVPIEISISTPKTPLTAALNELFKLKEQNQSGLYNALYQSNLKVESAKISNGTATIKLSGNLMLGGVMDHPRVKAQIEETALQFSSVKKVEVFLNGKTLDEALSLK